jgi:hypothetical protein
LTSDEIQKNQAAKRLGIRVGEDGVGLDARSVLASLGGWLGVAESIIPSTAFVLVYTLAHDAIAALITSISLSVGFLARQVIMRKPINQSIAGAVGIALTAWLVLRENGQAADYFVPGFITNICYGSVLLVSVIIRWPLLGVLVGFFKGDGTHWRKNRSQLARFSAATLIFVVLFGLRLLVQLPLYFTNSVEALGIARVVMGVPLYALCIWLSWLLLRGIIIQRR